MNGSTTQPGDAASVAVGKLSAPVAVSVGAVPIAVPAAAGMGAASDPNVAVAKLSPPTNVSSGAVPLAPVPPTPTQPPDAVATSLYSRSQNAEAAIAAAELAWKLIDAGLPNTSDFTYEIKELEGTRAPQDDPKWVTAGEWRHGSTHIRSGVMETNIGDEQSVEFDVDWFFNGHCVRDINIRKANSNPAVAWKLHVKNDIVPRPDLETPPPDAVAAVQVTFIYTHSHRVWGERIFREELVIFGNGKYTHAGWWTQYAHGTAPPVAAPEPDLQEHEEVQLPDRHVAYETRPR